MTQPDAVAHARAWAESAGGVFFTREEFDQLLEYLTLATAQAEQTRAAAVRLLASPDPLLERRN